MSPDAKTELFELLELLIEEEISDQQTQRLEHIVRSDRDAMTLYVDYIDLHGSLYWDTARSGDQTLPPEVMSSTPQTVVANAAPTSRQTKPQRSARWWMVACLIPLCVAGAYAWKQLAPLNQTIPNVVDNNPTDALPRDDEPERDIKPVQISIVDHTPTPENVVDNGFKPEPVPEPAPVRVASVVARIDRRIDSGLTIGGIEASPSADDAEWIRRVHLDLVGRIPDVQSVKAFLNDKTEDKRAQLVDRLLDDVGFVRHQATVWTNLLVGRSELREVNQAAVEKFLRNGFAANRGWDTMVADLITAEGSVEDNAASGFLLAHLNNQAVPATAITARMFLGMQVQCTQCHNHPFNDQTQEQFWAFNSIFKQITRKRTVIQTDAGKKHSFVSIVSKPSGGPTFYEDRRGLMKAAYPSFEGVDIPSEDSINRREELARILTTGDETQVARAFVNRVWSHLFGYGFTRPVDDMGPHTPVTHPELLSELSRSFVSSGYDLKQLFRWICNSEAYQRTSRFSKSNVADNPDDGSAPLFSRMYTRSMSAEQVYDSLLIATQAHKSPGFNWANADNQRHDWIQQFVYAHATDENDEASTFDGTITQALMMMNGDLIDDALSGDRGTMLRSVLARKTTDTERIELLSIAALSREPTSDELDRLRQMLRRLAGPKRQARVAVFLQDLFWAYLNSGEFAVVH